MLKLLTANTFNLDQSKILLHGKALTPISPLPLHYNRTEQNRTFIVDLYTVHHHYENQSAVSTVIG